jgi:hypothetical protein
MSKSVSSLKVVYYKDQRGMEVAETINSKAWILLSSVNIVMARADSKLIAYHHQLNTAT